MFTAAAFSCAAAHFYCCFTTFRMFRVLDGCYSCYYSNGSWSCRNCFVCVLLTSFSWLTFDNVFFLVPNFELRLLDFSEMRTYAMTLFLRNLSR